MSSATVYEEVLAGDRYPIRTAARDMGVHPQSVCRWVLTGLTVPGGTKVTLEAVRLGAKWFTSRAALKRFALASSGAKDAADAAALRSPNERQRASDRAGKELEDRGL